MSNQIEKQDLTKTPTNQMNQLVSNKAINKMFYETLKENAGAFLSSVTDLYKSEALLQKCQAEDVLMETLKAATLKLPINKQLGFAYIVPYKDTKTGQYKPQFQLGYKGYIQLAMRTGQYQNLNAGIIYEGMTIKQNYLAGTIEIHGQRENDNEIGYFAYFKLINGFEKCLYMSKEEIQQHAEKFSKMYKYSFKGSVWQTNFSSMALKTVTRLLLSKYGILSTEMQTAITQETDDKLQNEIKENANKQVINIADFKQEEFIDIDTGEVITQESNNKQLDGQIEMQIKKAPF